MSTINLNNFWSRTFSGALFVVAIIGSILINKWLFGALFLVVAFVAVKEFYSLINNVRDLRVQIVPGIISTIILYVSFTLFANQVIGWQILMVNMLIPVFVFINELYQKNETPILNIALTFLGIFYVGFPLALLNLYYNPHLIPGEYHPGLLMGFFVMLWSSDTFAYLTGKLLGKHKLFPSISPKKTWEGTIGGLFFGLAAAWILSLFYHEFDLINWLVIGGIIAVFGTFGDLSESLIKRSLNIKDSGKVLPGHGGLLDRFDAALFASPAVFVYMNLIYYFK